jgi:regulator of protease activity HflC (stomatin/prohibitin superfamily)
MLLCGRQTGIIILSNKEVEMNIADFFGFLAAFAWLALVGVVLFVVARATRQQSIRGAGVMVVVTFILAVVLTTVAAGLVFIEPQERGVVLSALDQQGYRTEALQPGLRWVVPFFEQVVRYPISRQTYTMSIAPNEGSVRGDDSVEARTADGQKVLVDASVIFSIDPARVVDVHIIWQGRYSIDLVRPLARGIIRDAVSQYGIEEVVSSKRFELVEDITTAMEGKLRENGIILGDFVLRNLSFSEEYAASVEQKQIAEQQAQQAKFVVEQRRQEAEQARQTAQGAADAAVIASQGAAQARLIEAEAEAKALALIAQVLQENPNLLTYQYITKLTPNIQVMLLPNNTPFLFPLPDMNAAPALPQIPQ